ncbi:MAG TPA: glycosyltransferase family 2 protein [Nitrososphaerales archaeon]|nr:glycosyltransferase family 2 protein [Nitrososphaerales archaeon]
MIKVACIPAYNEERTIGKVIVGTFEYVDKVIVCDDGSGDMTAAIAERLGADVIRHERNMGKGEAFRSLFSACRDMGADIMVTIDGDDQHDPADIPKLVDPVMKGYADVVLGSRFHSDNRGIPSYRKVGNKLLNAVTVPGVSDTQSGFRAYNKKAVEALRPSESGMGVDSEILMDASTQGLRLMEVPVSVMYGIGKTSTHNPIYHTVDVLTSAIKLTSIKHPMTFYGIPGLAVTLLGLYFVIHAYLIFLGKQVITDLVLTYALVGFSVAIFGLFTFFTGIILFTVSTILRKGTD